jgi:hypothetical protein
MMRLPLFAHCPPHRERVVPTITVAHLLLLAAAITSRAAPAQSDPTVLAVNCADGQQVLADGSIYYVDQIWEDGLDYGAIGGHRSNRLAPIHEFLYVDRGPDEMDLHDRWRIGAQGYRFRLDPGSYELTLHLAEFQRDGAGVAAFGVAAEGDTLYRDFDLAAEAGVARIVDLRDLVVVDDGILDLEFWDVDDRHPISAIGIRPARIDTTPPPRPAAMTALGTYGGVLVRWARGLQTDLQGYRLLKQGPGGEWQVAIDRALVPYGVIPTSEPIRAAVVSFDIYGNVSDTVFTDLVAPRPESDSDLQLYELQVAPEDLALLNENAANGAKVSGALWVDDVLRDDLTLEYRGSAQRRAPKKSWNVNLHDNLPLHDRSRLVLKATWIDPTIQRELLMTDLLTQAGAPHAGTFPIRFSLNGDYIGVMLDIERLDEEYLTLRGWDPTASFYRINTTLEVLDDIDEYREGTEAAGAGDWERRDIIAFTEGLNRTAAADLLPWLEENVDLDTYLTVICHNAVGANEDWLHDDYYLYHDPVDGRWVYLPWDLHEGWHQVHRDIDAGTHDNPVIFDWNRLFDRVLSVPSLRRAYTERLAAYISTGHMTPEALHATLRDRAVTMWEDMEIDTNKLSRETFPQYVAEMRKLDDFFAPRVDYLFDEIDRYAPAEEVFIKLSELLPDPLGTAFSQVEIENLATRDFDFSGFALTNDPGDPRKWPLGAATIGADGRLLIDLDPPLAAGSWLALARVGGSDWVDTLRAPDQVTAGHSYGRFPDHSDRWRLLDALSPGTPNLWSSPLEGELLVTPATAFSDVEGSVPLSPALPGADYAIVHEGDRIAIQITLLNSSERSIATNLELRLASREGILLTPTPLASLPLLVPADDSATRIVHARVPSDLYAIGSYRLQLAAKVEGALWASAEAELFLEGDPLYPLVINELMAINDTTIADDAGEFDDWIEILNASDQPVSLSGLYVTDDPEDDPLRFALPDRTLAARERLLIWCDNDPEQGPEHATFKLGGSGEAIALVEADGSRPVLRDLWVFGPQQADRSIGRFPDGNPSWVTLLAPSPLAPNAY